jgi:hypothetical protein
MLKEKRITLPWPSSGLVGEPTLSADRGDLHLALQLVCAGRKCRARFIFAKQRAFRKRAEIHCTKWHVEDALDTVCEVRNSDWAAELSESTCNAWRNRWVMRHFMIYLEKFGCVEVIAESVCIALAPSDGA